MDTSKLLNKMGYLPWKGAASLLQKEVTCVTWWKQELVCPPWKRAAHLLKKALMVLQHEGQVLLEPPQLNTSWLLLEALQEEHNRLMEPSMEGNMAGYGEEGELGFFPLILKEHGAFVAGWSGLEG